MCTYIPSFWDLPPLPHPTLLGHPRATELSCLWEPTAGSHCCCLVAQSCLTLCNPMVCSLPGSSVHGIFPARILEWNSLSKNTEVGCRSLLQGIFPAQGMNLCLLHCTQTLYCLSHQGSPGKVPTSYLLHTWQCTYINTNLPVHGNPLL